MTESSHRLALIDSEFRLPEPMMLFRLSLSTSAMPVTRFERHTKAAQTNCLFARL
jgi:hypothetical protein